MCFLRRRLRDSGLSISRRARSLVRVPIRRTPSPSFTSAAPPVSPSAAVVVVEALGLVALGTLWFGRGSSPAQPAAYTTLSTAAPEAAAFGPMQMENIVQQVADRILVSPPGAGGQEVRIMIKDSILPGTEVRITQTAGQLQISLVTNDARSHELLATHQATLQERLTEKLGKHEVAVKVEMDGGGQPDRDGRSRNQRDIESELRENAE